MTKLRLREMNSPKVMELGNSKSRLSFLSLKPVVLPSTLLLSRALATQGTHKGIV